MSNQPQWNNPAGAPYDGPYQGSPADQPVKQGMGCGMKLFLGCLGMFGLLCLVCCGGGYWMSKNGMQEDSTPEGVRTTTAEIVDMEVPATFVPEQAVTMNMFGFLKMKIAVYKARKGVEGQLALMQFAMPEAMAEQQKEAFQQQNPGQRQNSEKLVELKSETRKFKIRGEDSSFQFTELEHKDTKEKWRGVSGTFPSKEGSGLLNLQVQESAYDEKEIIKMIESIR